MAANKTQRLRDYIKANPGVKAAELAKKFKTTAKYVYLVRSKLKLTPEADKATTTVTYKTRGRPKKVGTLDLGVFEMVKPLQLGDMINHPDHYKDGGIETIDFIEAKNLNYNLGNVVKYVSRAGKKSVDPVPDLRKALWYLNREINSRKVK